jgi:hypothetical protein
MWQLVSEVGLDWAHRWIAIYVTDNHGQLDNTAYRHSKYPSLFVMTCILSLTGTLVKTLTTSKLTRVSRLWRFTYFNNHRKQPEFFIQVSNFLAGLSTLWRQPVILLYHYFYKYKLQLVSSLCFLILLCNEILIICTFCTYTSFMPHNTRRCRWQSFVR